MREILFRGKRVDNSELVEGFYVKCRGRHYILPVYDIDHGFDERYSEWIEIDPKTVCQYTGYSDINGRKIFEGDIVGFLDMISTESGYSEMDCCGKVGYDEEEACFYVTDRLSAESWEVLGECHIIGNIFDNPGLAEVKEGNGEINKKICI